MMYYAYVVLSGVAVVMLLSYIIWSYRPPRPDLVVYKYRGTDCEIEWTCPTEQEQYKCHLLPSVIAKRLPINHYLIDVKKGAEDQWRTVGIKQHGEPQKYSVQNLFIGSQVEFRVLTVNILGRRSFPSESSPVFRVVDKPFPPGTPWVEDVIRDESDRSCVRTSCELRWSPPPSNQGASVSKYKICQTEDYCSWGLAGEVAANTLACRVETLQPGTVVQFNMIATNLVGDSKPSDTSPLYYVIDRPGQPKKPWFQEFTTASCSLNWDKPDFDGGCEISKYIVQRRENHADWKLYTNFTPQTEKPLALKILGLKVNARVTFRIIAVNLIGESCPSTPSSLYAPDCSEETENLASCSCSPNSNQNEFLEKKLRTESEHSTIVETEL